MVTPCTSRKAKFSTVDKSPFAISYLPSVVSTLARSREANLDVVFYVGYDAGEHGQFLQSTVLGRLCLEKLGAVLCCAAGDRVWDTDAAREAAPALLRRLFGWHNTPAGAAGLVPTLALGLRLVRCETDNMVAASNCAVRAAYEDGADYWYR